MANLFEAITTPWIKNFTELNIGIGGKGPVWRISLTDREELAVATTLYAMMRDVNKMAVLAGTRRPAIVLDPECPNTRRLRPQVSAWGFCEPDANGLSIGVGHCDNFGPKFFDVVHEEMAHGADLGDGRLNKGRGFYKSMLSMQYVDDTAFIHAMEDNPGPPLDKMLAAAPDNALIHGYRTIPHYKTPGRTMALPRDVKAHALMVHLSPVSYTNNTNFADSMRTNSELPMIEMYAKASAAVNLLQGMHSMDRSEGRRALETLIPKVNTSKGMSVTYAQEMVDNAIIKGNGIDYSKEPDVQQTFRNLEALIREKRKKLGLDDVFEGPGGNQSAADSGFTFKITPLKTPRNRGE